jgi:hypothetical protein
MGQAGRARKFFDYPWISEQKLDAPLLRDHQELSRAMKRKVFGVRVKEREEDPRAQGSLPPNVPNLFDALRWRVKPTRGLLFKTHPAKPAVL